MNRFTDMQVTAKRVLAEFEQFELCGNNLTTTPWVTELLRTKLSKQPIRAYFVAKTAQRLSPHTTLFNRYRLNTIAGKHLFETQLPFLFEVVITIQYLHNQIFDGKAGVTTSGSITHNILAANLLKDQLYRYVDQKLPSWSRSSVLKELRWCFEMVDYGQYLEKHYNTFAAFSKGDFKTEQALPPSILNDIDWSGQLAFLDKLKAELPTKLHSSLDVYFQRIYLTCAALFVGASRLLGTLMGVDSEKLRPVLQFSVSYGLMRQLVNDNADWVPSSFHVQTTDKVASDAFSDLQNNTFTLPIFFYLANQNTGLLHDLLDGSKPFSSIKESDLFDEIITSGALYRSIQNTRILAELAQAYLPMEEMASAYLAQSCEIVHWNKFLAPCLQHASYQAYRKTTYHRRTKALIKQLRRQRTQDQQPAPSALSWRHWFPQIASPNLAPMERLLRKSYA